MAVFDYLKAVGKTDVGLKRKNNEDNFGLFPTLGVWLVADGMGGGDDGEVASAAVVSEMSKVTDACGVPATGAYAADDVLRAVIAAADRASSWIFLRARQKRLSGCGSTVVGCVADPTRPGRMVAFHAGDSRLYRLRGRRLKQITTDHSVAEMIGEKDESKVNPMFRGMVFRAVGIKASVEVEQTEFDVKPGDRILICSDGLTKMVPDRKIASLLRGEADVGRAVDALIAAANGAGGIDNVTAILIEVGDLPAAATPVPLSVNIGESETLSSQRATGDTGIVVGINREESASNAVSAPDQVTGDCVSIQAEPAPVEAPKVRAKPIKTGGTSLRRVVRFAAGGLFLVAVVGGGYYAAQHENKGVDRTDDVQIADVKPIEAEKTPPPTAAGTGTNSLIETLMATSTTVTARATNAVSAKVATRAKPPPGCEELARHCSATELMMLKESIVRRLSAEKATQFSEQMNRVLSAAKTVHRMKSPEASARFVVDLKYALQAAGDVRPLLSKDRVLAHDWDLIAEGEGTADVLRFAAVRLLKNLPGVLH